MCRINTRWQDPAKQQLIANQPPQKPVRCGLLLYGTYGIQSSFATHFAAAGGSTQMQSIYRLAEQCKHLARLITTPKQERPGDMLHNTLPALTPANCRRQLLSNCQHKCYWQSSKRAAAVASLAAAHEAYAICCRVGCCRLPCRCHRCCVFSCNEPHNHLLPCSHAGVG